MCWGGDEREEEKKATVRESMSEWEREAHISLRSTTTTSASANDTTIWRWRQRGEKMLYEENAAQKTKRRRVGWGADEMTLSRFGWDLQLEIYFTVSYRSYQWN